MMAGRRRMVAAGLALAVGGGLASGCGPAAGAGAGAARPGKASSGSSPASVRDGLTGMLSFHYVGASDTDDTINQTLQIHNAVHRSATAELSLKALDKSGRVLPGVTVSTVYGGDRGNLVLPYGYTYDILRFSGPGRRDVADVRVSVRDAAFARVRAGTHEVSTQALDSRGREITRFERFTAVRLTNSDDFPVAVRLAYILWDQPPKGATQQAVEITPVGGLTQVPAHGTAVVQVTGKAAAAVARNSYGPAVSIKAYDSQ